MDTDKPEDGQVESKPDVDADKKKKKDPIAEAGVIGQEAVMMRREAKKKQQKEYKENLEKTCEFHNPVSELTSQGTPPTTPRFPEIRTRRCSSLASPPRRRKPTCATSSRCTATLRKSASCATSVRASHGTMPSLSSSVSVT